MNLRDKLHRWTGILCLPLLTTTLGCWGSNLPTTYPVSGVVTYRGKPLEGASVNFVPSSAEARPAGGITQSDGSFTLLTYYDSENQLKGAMAGDFVITVSKMEARAIKEDLKPEEAIAEFRKLGAPKNLLPASYQSPATSKLKTTVGPKLEKLTLNIEP